jgi:acetyl esterase/lipase
VGEPFVSLVPDVDADGNDRGGIRIPQIEAPVATYTPWNLRDPSIGAPWARVSFLGSYFPLARNEEDRSAAGDPRRSLAERYASFEEYLGRYAQAARRLITERFLLPEDLEGVLARGVQEWRYANEGFERPLLTSADDLYRLTIAPPPDARVSYGDEPFEFGEPRLPEGPGPHPVAIVVHGGCWLAQYDMAHARAMSEALASAGIAAWTVEYRRVGDEGGGWSGTFLDVARGADHLRVLARSYPLDLSRVIAVGHSAGGQFALWLAARERLPAGSPLRAADPVRLRGVVGLAAAGDLAFLHERGVCGDVIDKLMGGSPASVPDRYATGSPAQLVPLGTRQILISGARDELWSSVAARYIEAARAAGADLRVIEAPESGHFEMIDPSSSTWPFIRDAALELLGK